MLYIGLEWKEAIVIRVGRPLQAVSNAFTRDRFSQFRRIDPVIPDSPVVQCLSCHKEKYIVFKPQMVIL